MERIGVATSLRRANGQTSSGSFVTRERAEPSQDRTMQALHLLALEPVAETTADKNSYGFRPERSTTDAIEQCYKALAKSGRRPMVA